VTAPLRKTSFDVIDILGEGAGLKPAPADSAGLITAQRRQLDIFAYDHEVVMAVNQQFMGSYSSLPI